MLKEHVISQINTLTAEELMLIYGYIELLKNRYPKDLTQSQTAHLQVREALKGLNGSLSEDILLARNERI
jgi:hypothetical protein